MNDKMVEVKCSHCGKTFQTYPSRIKMGQGKFCSKKCADASRRTQVERKCPICGKKFLIKPSKLKKGWGKYCSPACSYKAQKGVSKKHEGSKKRTCPICKKEFTVFKSHLKVGEGIYCSRECADISKIDKITYKCKFCGKEFETYPYMLKKNIGMFCSRECYDNARYNTEIRQCKLCGKEFQTYGSLNKGKGLVYCSQECSSKDKENKVIVKCYTCGKSMERILSKINSRNFCSDECYRKGRSGKHHHAWKGGISFEPYCAKFNEEFKERVRNFFDRKCMLCGKEEDGKKLSVHHVSYDKKVCCNEGIPMFLPLCVSCHTKTNYNREYWEENLTNYVMIYFNGESFSSK